MTLPKLSDLQVFSWLRILCGLHLLIYQFSIQLPNFINFYGAEGMVNPKLFQFFKDSPLFYFWEMDFLKILLFVLTIALSLAFSLGFYARIVHIPLFILTLCFQMANPMVIHEPQQLTQLLLFVLWLLPYEKHLVLQKSPGFKTYESVDESLGQKLVMVLLGFLAFYYLMAGLKKLPDPLWLEGKALAVFVGSPYLGKTNFFSQLFLYPLISIAASWLTILFEVSFVFLVFTSLRKFLFIVGLLFHIANIFVFNVGLFWMAMLMWYPLLLFKKGARKPLAP